MIGASSETGNLGLDHRAWAARGGELAEWAWERCVNRTDVWGGYNPVADRKKKYVGKGGKETELGPTTTRPRRSRRGKEVLTKELLTGHFRATAPEHLVGLHTTSTENTSRWGALEIDWHGEGSTDPEINWKAALGWHSELTQLGFRPLLTDSNGKGGYHLRILLAEPAPTPRLFWFLRWLVKDHGARGLPNAPETFPKQSSIKPDKFGNWLRLPGLHHTRPHWAKVWDGNAWADGDKAVDFLLSLTGDSPTLIPEDIEWQYRIGKYMAKLPNLGEGQGRDGVAFTFLAFLVRDLHLDDEYALGWANRWDAGNRPPKGPEALREILTNVHQYGRNGYGSGRRQGPADAGGDKNAEVPEQDGQPADNDRPAEEWPAPIPFDDARDLPPFPTRLLPAILAEWVEAESTAKQTPPDLAAQLALSVCGAALATKFRVKVRDGWAEPTNIFTVASLLPGERKSAVFTDALDPVVQHEREEQERMAPVIAAAASEHRTMEARLKIAEHQAAKAEAPEERRQLLHDAKELAKELAAHVVPEAPQMFCDDETPESLGRLIAKQGGRMLQAAAEGTAFEIVKGRYSESPNFDVYLKGHAGDPLRTGRVGRERDTVDCPALSVALAVQPDVIAGLAEQAMLRGRGFLARYLYAMPVSLVGGRTINAPPVPARTEAAYRDTVLSLWRLEGTVGQDGKPAPHWLTFSPAADRRLQDFEAWLEPQMAEGEDLSLLAGWAQKLAGAAARIAGVLHVAAAVSEGRPWNAPIGERTAAAAVELARDYYLPHAQTAFAAMGADARLADARHAWEAIARRCAHAAHSADAPPCVSRRDIHNWNRRRFPTVEELDPAVGVLVDRYFLLPVDGAGQPGKGHKSPLYRVNPLAIRDFVKAPPRSHSAHCTHMNGDGRASAHAAHGADAPARSETEAEAESNGYTAPGYDPDDNPFHDELEV